MKTVPATNFEAVGAQCERDYNDFFYARQNSKRERKAERKAAQRLTELRLMFTYDKHVLHCLYDESTPLDAYRLALLTGRNVLSTTVTTPFRMYCTTDKAWRDTEVIEGSEFKLDLVYTDLMIGIIETEDSPIMPTGLVVCGVGVDPSLSDPSSPSPTITSYLIPAIGNIFEPKGRTFN